MKPTRIDLKFWQSKKVPKWGQGYLPNHRGYKPIVPKVNEGVSIHSVVNSHLGHDERDKRDDSHVIHNTMNICRYAIRNSHLIEKLYHMMYHPGCSQGKKRSALCKRWLKKLKKST